MGRNVLNSVMTASRNRDVANPLTAGDKYSRSVFTDFSCTFSWGSRALGTPVASWKILVIGAFKAPGGRIAVSQGSRAAERTYRPGLDCSHEWKD